MKKIIFIISFFLFLIETVLGQNENSKLLHQEIDRYFQTVFEKSPAPGFSVVIVKKDKKNVSLNIVGRCLGAYKEFLLKRINGLNLEENIVFNDYFPLHSDMHQHIVQSHFAVLPVKLDIISGSVIEAILLDLPVVTYKTTGTPYLNRDGESVLIANIGDINTLARQMLKLLNSPSLAQKLRENAKAFVEQEFDNATSAKRLVSNYRAVIDHYHNDAPIPEKLLFNTNEFPLY
jgi:glycosyltransferase involved in cell wall biosynthesis